MGVQVGRAVEGFLADHADVRADFFDAIVGLFVETQLRQAVEVFFAGPARVGGLFGGF